MRYLNKIIFINSARIQYAEIQIDGNVHFIGTQEWGKVRRCVHYSSFTMPIRQSWAFQKRKRVLMNTIFRTSIHTLFMKWWWMMLRIAYWLSVRREGVCFRFLGTGYKKEYFISPEGKAYEEWDQIRDALGSFVYKSRRIETMRSIETLFSVMAGASSGVSEVCYYRKPAVPEYTSDDSECFSELKT